MPRDSVTDDLSLPKENGINRLLSYQILQILMLKAVMKASPHNLFTVGLPLSLSFTEHEFLSVKRRDFK